MSKESGRVSCRKVSRREAAALVATSHGISETAANRRIASNIANYYDNVDLKPPKGGGYRFIDLKHLDEGLSVCSDTRDYAKKASRREMWKPPRNGAAKSGSRGKRAAKTFFGSKAGWTVVGAVAGFILAKVF